jgi:hypothetical protein
MYPWTVLPLLLMQAIHEIEGIIIIFPYGPAAHTLSELSCTTPLHTCVKRALQLAKKPSALTCPMLIGANMG